MPILLKYLSRAAEDITDNVRTIFLCPKEIGPDSKKRHHAIEAIEVDARLFACVFCPAKQGLSGA